MWCLGAFEVPWGVPFVRALRDSAAGTGRGHHVAGRLTDVPDTVTSQSGRPESSVDVPRTSRPHHCRLSSANTAGRQAARHGARAVWGRGVCTDVWEGLVQETNERLRSAIYAANLTPAEVADELGVDRKSVDRWIGGRTPYRRHRAAAGRLLGVDDALLWPEATTPAEVAEASEQEVIHHYPHRWAVPREAFMRLFESATEQIDVLVYSGFFLAEDRGIQRLLINKTREGVRVRILLGDPDSTNVAERGADEGIGEAMAAKIRNALVLYAPLRRLNGAEVRLHDTTLYNSIYRADDQLLVNGHIYGAPASQAPVTHLRRVSGGELVAEYLDSFDRVWDNARPADPID